MSFDVLRQIDDIIASMISGDDRVSQAAAAVIAAGIPSPAAAAAAQVQT